VTGEVAASGPGLIRRLPREVVGRIAAGEMISRPSAAVKELIENALDAGARRIHVDIVEALDRRLEIADDGCGIPRDELSLALERYTTSKIRREEDLLAVETLGFRGEALAAIAEIARVTLVSRAAGAEHAWMVRAEGGRIGEPEPASRASGTTVIVEDLFFNTPVRKRFLRGGPGEMRLAREAIVAYALAYPGTAWQVTQDGRTALELAPAPDLRTRLVQIHGVRIAESLLAVDAGEEGGLGLRGFVGVPELARAGGRHQAFFVNGRWVASPWLGQAVRQAYGDLIPRHQAPWAVLFLTVPPDRVDVNLHPTKREVRFLDEAAIFGFVQRAVRPSLTRLLPRLFRGLDAPADGEGRAPDAARPGPGRPGEPRVAPQGSFDGLEQARRIYGATDGPARPGPWSLGGGDLVADAAEAALPAEREAELVSLWQLHHRYVLAQTRKGLLIIDQHAAHERILYEQILDRFERETGSSQQLLFPVALEMTDEEMELFRQLEDGLGRLGFDAERLSERSLIVRGVPLLWRIRGEASLLRDLLDEADALGMRAGETAEGLARAFACRAAIQAGESLGVEEMNQLVDQLFATRTPHGDPHGRPTFVFLSLADLDRRFGRSPADG
jgi:DNA mismatch repair protein MutL